MTPTPVRWHWSGATPVPDGSSGTVRYSGEVHLHAP